MDDPLVEFVARQHDRVSGDTPVRPAGCLDENDWALLADDLLSPSQREALVEHVSRCPACRCTAGQIVAESPRTIRWPIPWQRLGVFAAAACLAIAVGAYLLHSRRDLDGEDMLAQAAQQMANKEYQAARGTLDQLLARTELDVELREKARLLYEKSYLAGAQIKLDRQQYAEAEQELAEAMRRGYTSAETKRLRGQAMMATAVALATPEDRLTMLGLAGIGKGPAKSMPAPVASQAASQAALDLLREAVREQPASAAGWRDLGLSLLSNRYFDDAVETLGHWTQIEPQKPEAHNARGLALYGAGRHAEAATAFRQAATLAPGVAAYQMNSAIACEDAGSLREAIKHWKQYLSLSPTGPDAEEIRKWLEVLEKGLEQ